MHGTGGEREIGLRFIGDAMTLQEDLRAASGRAGCARAVVVLVGFPCDRLEPGWLAGFFGSRERAFLNTLFVFARVRRAPGIFFVRFVSLRC